jgi:salicylate hydroxylase
MTRQALIAGGGIGALAAALSVARAGWEVRLYEQASAFSEVGAGLQLGPNATRLLQGWGLGQALSQVAAFPEKLCVRSAPSGRELGVLKLGKRSLERYGAPYATVHRGDLHALLLSSVAARAAVHLNLNATVAAYDLTPDGVEMALADGHRVEGDVLIGADGLWSQVRRQGLTDGAAKPVGHLAFRALVRQTDLPAGLRSQFVNVWLGPRLHVVSYPVRAGEMLNVVVIAQGEPPADVENWDHAGLSAEVCAALAGSCAPLLDLIESMPSWRLWALCERAPLTAADQMAFGRVALLGDAAHPMRPYLAQGAGMAIEDAAELGRCLVSVAKPQTDAPLALRRYALQRWERNARVQARAVRNGRIFHATGLLRLGRDMALKLIGQRLLDLPWLYGEGAAAGSTPAQSNGRGTRLSP